ncbi:hypothetical protein Barb7_01529 [Bacteroidales bacterium Barb7]|nr:hypothetical protein Barb7_01529 [Bacteroidales bacterium Barb7]
MSRLYPVDVNVVVGKDGATYGGNANHFLLQLHVSDNFGNQFVDDTVTAPRTIVHRIVIHQLRLAVHPILRLYDFICIHILMIKKYVLYIE